MRKVLVWGCLVLLPGCALSDRDINLNASADQEVQMANAIGPSGPPICLPIDQEDWSDISD